MTTEAQLRRAALGLPGVEEGTEEKESVVFAVEGKTFASLTQEGQVRLHLDVTDSASALADLPDAEPLERGNGITIALERVNGQALNYLVRRAWFAQAPKELTDALAAADSAAAGEVGDLPRAIGRPATRALAGAGVTTLADVARHSEDELLALHGVGPRAIRILREALEARGLEMGSG
ncbi:MAG TPA: hypothetical protein VK070_10675 [Acidimicrobiia bacterium]|nr:hypothetical protein [Acidimicrobiia bacterium]